MTHRAPRRRPARTSADSAPEPWSEPSAFDSVWGPTTESAPILATSVISGSAIPEPIQSSSAAPLMLVKTVTAMVSVAGCACGNGAVWGAGTLTPVLTSADGAVDTTSSTATARGVTDAIRALPNTRDEADLLTWLSL